MSAGHEGPCPWEGEPSKARQGVDRLLAVMRNREIESLDSQPERPDREVGNAIVLGQSRGPWVLVTFVGGDEFAIWKETGSVYRVGADGAVEDDPIITVS